MLFDLISEILTLLIYKMQTLLRKVDVHVVVDVPTNDSMPISKLF